MENPAGPSEPATAMHMQGKVSFYLMMTMHYLMLTTNKLKPYGNSNVGVHHQPSSKRSVQAILS